MGQASWRRGCDRRRRYGGGRLQKQLERERERKARVKERKSQTFPNGLEMWKCSGRSDVVLVDSKVRRDLMS